MAKKYHSLGEFYNEIEYHEKSLSIVKEIGDRSGEGKAYGNIGCAYQSLGEFHKAIACHEKSLRIADEIGDRSGEGKAYGNIGYSYQSLGEFHKAIACHEKSLRIADEIGDRSGEGKAYGNIGYAYQSLGEFHKAIEYHEKNLSIAKEIGDIQEEGTSYLNQGNLYRSLGEFANAIEYLEKSLSIAKQIGNKAIEASTYGKIGNVYHTMGQYIRAIEYHEKSFSIAKEIGDRMGEGTVYGNLGIAYQSLGEYRKAFEYHERSLSIAKEIGDRMGERTVYGNLGNAYQSLGEYTKAREYSERSLSIAKEIGDRKGECTAYGNLGVVSQAINEYQKAIFYLQKSVDIAKMIGDTSSEGIFCEALGGAYQSIGQHRKGNEFLERFLRVAKETGDKNGEKRAYENLAKSCQSVGEYHKAIEYQEKFIDIAKEIGDRQGEVLGYRTLVSAYQLIGEYKTAASYLRKHFTGFAEIVRSMPPEIIAQGPFAEESYRKAFYHGSVQIYRACVKIIGQEGAGKTCLKRSLQGLPFNPLQESTVGVEVSLCKPVTRNNIMIWQMKENDGIIVDDDFAFVMAKDIKKQGDVTKDTRAIDVSSEPHKQADQVSSESVQVPNKVEQSPERKIDETIKDNQETENHEATTKKILESSSKQNLQVPDEVKMSLIKYLQEKKIDETIRDKEVAISIWDFAGQHLYYASHPVFMSHRAIYILVYNLGKDLDDKAEPRARQGTREIVLDNASNETNLDNLLSWLVSVHCLCQPHTDSRVGTKDYICPPVIIVGTHADELTGSEDERERLVEIQRRKIDSAIEKCEFQNHVLKPFFVVDNNNSKDDDGIKSLHSKINEVLNMEPYFPEPVPIRWFHFEKALQSLVQEKKTPFLSVKELSEIAEQVCSIDQTEIAAMLNFYHDLGIIIKYGDTVVLDAKWLINLFKSLITIEPDEVKPRHRKFWRELAETGRLHTDLINHVFQELSEARDDAKKDILDMMEYFGLISKIIPSNQKDGYCHLVPSHLTSSPEHELKKCQPSSDEPCPLYIRFKDGFIPHGLYFQLICRWCSIYGSQKQQTLFQKEPKLFRNAAKFVLDKNSKVIMTVVCCKSTIKVCLHSNRENKTGIDFKAVEIKQLVQESLDSLTEKCPWYQGLQYDLCIRCPLCAVNATGKAEGHLFRDDNCLHPTTDDEEFCCEEKDEWPEVLGLHHWFSRPTVSFDMILWDSEIEPSDRQSVIGDVRVSNGLFVVINIAKFDQRLKKLSDRIGSEYDEKAMVELFGDYFGFEVVNLSNKDGAVEIKQELRNISFHKKYEDKDCFVLCIMSHGDKGVFYTSEGQAIEYEEIVSYFENGMCKSFRGKPKLFIIQACRGGDVDRGVAVTDFPADPRGNKESQESCAIHQQSSEREHVISCKTNILQAFCCSKGYISCRDLNSGSYYIQSLVRIFRRFASTEDVVRMLERVNKDVSSKQMQLTDEPRVKQGPTFSSSLGDVVYFCTK